MTIFSLLPRHLTVSCFSNVPLIHYRTVSLASKTIASLISSPELYAARSQENLVYVCLAYSNGVPTWFTLSKNPNSTTKLTGYWLIPISMEVSYPASMSMATSKRKIYMLGTQNPNELGSRLKIFDCVSCDWSETQPMRHARNNKAVLMEIEEKIWVLGGTNEARTLNAEVYCPRTRRWECAPEPDHMEQKVSLVSSNSDGDMVEVEYKVSVVLMNSADNMVEIWATLGSEGIKLTFNPNDSIWGKCCSRFGHSPRKCLTVAIDKSIFRIHGDSLICYDKETMFWSSVEGYGVFEEEPFHAMAYGNNLLALSNGLCDGRKVIWCTQVSFERDGEDMVGRLVWRDVIYIEDYASFLGSITVRL